MTLWSLLMIVIYCGYTTLLVKIFSLLPGGFVAGIGGLILGVIFIPVLTISAWQAALVLACQLASGVLAMWLLGASSFEIQNALYWVGGGVGFAIAFAYLLDVINRYAFHLERQLAEEKSRSEALLLNILPADVAARLKAREEPLADHHESVSVLFADLAGFTELSRHLTAEELVDLLNDLFSRFDRLAVEHGAEKIKTIGDAYMVATGLSGSVADHAERIADLALGMQQAFGRFRAERGLDLKLRIGVHSGAVIAGVIGEQKFSYDLWGDTVNVASRMESGGLPDRIQISVETREQLPERYRTTARGEIELKGHQARRAFLLEPANHE